jgi:hypothetical protein
MRMSMGLNFGERDHYRNAELKGFVFEVIASNLTKEQEDQLMAAFAEE